MGPKLGEPIDVGLPRCWNGELTPENKGLVDLQKGGRIRRVAVTCWTQAAQDR
ncbi:jg27311, partial [Pararge aegeria aegeria]